MAAVNKYYTFNGVVLMAMIWYCWHERRDVKDRVPILVGTLASLAAGRISRFLQHALPTHPRPYYDPVLNFHIPFSPEAPSNTWDSFPSDHVAVFAGLTVVLFIAGPSFVVFAIAWTIVVESVRIYMGGHYPSDLIGGAALGAILVWAAQTSGPISLGQKVMRWEQSSPAVFYMAAFFLSYQIATLFADFRSTLGPVKDYLFKASPLHISAASDAARLGHVNVERQIGRALFRCDSPQTDHPNICQTVYIQSEDDRYSKSELSDTTCPWAT
jgi:undecaprenyl-diphosphatase